MAGEIEFSFPEIGLEGVARAFTEATFDAFLDDMTRNADDAAQGLMVRAVIEPGYEAIRKVAEGFPLLANRICDILTEDAGATRSSANLDDALNAETPPGLLGIAGLSAEQAAELLAKHAPAALRLLTVCDGDRKPIVSVVLRTPDDATLALLREPGGKKGYGKACRSAALSAIVWSSKPIAEVFARYPAIPAFVLAEKIASMGDRSAARRFRRR